MGEGSRSQVRASPGYETLHVTKIKMVGDGDGAYFELDTGTSKRQAELLELSPTGVLTVSEKQELESLMPTRRILSGPDLAPVLDGFVALDGKSDRVYMRFGRQFGFLGLCNKHGLPYKHPRNKTAMGAAMDLFAAPEMKQVLSQVGSVPECGNAGFERLIYWRWLAKWVKSAVMLAAILRENRVHAGSKPEKFGDQGDWQSLDWEACQSGISVNAPKKQVDAESLLELYVNYGLNWGEVRPYLAWTSGLPTVGFQGHTLWDHIVRQLLFRIAGGSVCVPFVTVRYPKGRRSFAKLVGRPDLM